MKKNHLLAFIFVFMIILIVTGCSGTPSTAPEPEAPGGETPEAPAPESETPAKVFKLKMDKTTAETQKSSQLEAEMTDRVRERTNGGLDITIYFSSTLIDPQDTVKGLENGIIDMAGYGFSGNPNAHFMLPMIMLDFFGFPESDVAYEMWPLIFKKWEEEFQRDLKNVKHLGTRFFANGDMLNTTNKPVTVPADLNGMKIIQRGEVFANSIKQVGGAALDIQTPEVYNALERGLADGNIWPPGVIRAFGTGELYKYHTIFEPISMKTPSHSYLINMEVWDSLPPDYQQILLEEVDWMCRAIMEMEKTDDAELMEEQLARGAEIIRPTLEQLEEWQALFVPNHEIFLKNAEDAGFPEVREIYDDIQRIFKVYRETGEIQID
ncbi:MAG TPA: TRAP transporter substrate-binding protein DctP [Firmicutes bacterium]|jgi:TRAP-type C4-dicarboxylate transport system substrate-binding protein|nr:TRAP transporter substrate-binding protein DctP [Bacillota bacterium]